MRRSRHRKPIHCIGFPDKSKGAWFITRCCTQLAHCGIMTCPWRAHACPDCCRYFTWDQHLFPHPAQLQDDLASHGRRMVTIIDPHIKRDPSYYIYQEAEKAGYFVKDKDGKDFDGCAPPFNPC